MKNLVNAVYEQTLLDREKRERSQRHYPSSACAVTAQGFVGKCRRATWYEWKGEEVTDPPDAPALFKMNVGDIIHAELDEKLRRHLELTAPGSAVKVEEPFLWPCEGLKYPFSGRIDFVLEAEGKHFAVEWKSTYGRGTDSIKSQGPKVEHLLQCLIYLSQPEVALGKKLDAVALIYAARDSGYLFGYWIEASEGKLLVSAMGSTKVTVYELGIEHVVAGTRVLEEYLDGDDPPAKDFGKGCWQCDYCSYRKRCDGDAR